MTERVTTSWLRRLWPFLARHRRKVYAAFGVSLGTTLITASIPLIERAVVDNVIVTDQQRALAAARAARRTRGGELRPLVHPAPRPAAGSRSTCSTTCAPRSSNGCNASTSRTTTSSPPARSCRARAPTSA